MTWPSHDLTPQQTSRHQNTSLQSTKHHHHGTAEGSFTAKKWFGHRAGRSPCAHSIGKFFLCYIVLFLFGNFRPRLVRALPVYGFKSGACFPSNPTMLGGFGKSYKSCSSQIGSTYASGKPWVIFHNMCEEQILAIKKHPVKSLLRKKHHQNWRRVSNSRLICFPAIFTI